MEMKKLYRSRADKRIAGVCGGFAEYFGIDATIVRLLVVLFVLVAGTGVFAYIIAWFIIPVRPDYSNYNNFNNFINYNDSGNGGNP